MWRRCLHREDNLTFVRDTFWKVMFAAEKSRLELFSSQIDNDIERKLFQSTLLMMDSTKTLKDVPTSLEFICQTWQELARVRACVVSQSQTRTPMDIALNIIATVPSLCSGSGDKDEMWKKMLDPASGSGLLIALAMHRAMLESNVLAGGMMVMEEKEKEKEKEVEMEMEMEMPMDANKEENKDADEKGDGSIRSHKKREPAAEEKRRLVEWCVRMVNSTHAIDLDATSCALTRVSMLCSLRPLEIRVCCCEQAGQQARPPRQRGEEAARKEEGGKDTTVSPLTRWISSIVPPLNVICGSAPTFVMDPVLSMLEGVTKEDCKIRDRYDVVVQNPPYRNKAREYEECDGRAFEFLKWKKATTPEDESGVTSITEQQKSKSLHQSSWSTFCGHHNLYGYFLELGRMCLQPNHGIMTAVVLRNVLDLHKYPCDALFHRHLLEKTTILNITFNRVESFDLLPHASRHKEGIPTVTLTIRSEPPLMGHRVRVVGGGVAEAVEAAEGVQGEEKEESVLQEELLECGLGVVDVLLRRKYTREKLIARWREAD